MSGNGKRQPPRPRIEVAAANASPEEAAVISAALQRFLADTAPAAGRSEAQGRWLRAALREGVEHAPAAEVWGGSP
jgi:hypothetical protein